VYHHLIACSILSVCLTSCFAQSSSTLIGARAAGIAYASSCLKDEWSIFNNIAGLASVENLAVAFSYDAQPSFKPFNRFAAVFALPTKLGTIGAGLFQFGDKLYNEQILTFGFSNSFGLASLGLKVHYTQYKASGFGSKGVFSVSFGGIAKLTDEISVGAHIININQSKISTIYEEQISTVLVIGIGLKLAAQTFITTELEKDLHYPVKWKTGFEYYPFKKFGFRTGFNLNPSIAFVGFEFRSAKFKLDYAYQHNFTVGSRHTASVGYTIRPR
jgi:hypothetical protein